MKSGFYNTEIKKEQQLYFYRVSNLQYKYKTLIVAPKKILTFLARLSEILDLFQMLHLNDILYANSCIMKKNLKTSKIYPNSSQNH